MSPHDRNDLVELFAGPMGPGEPLTVAADSFVVRLSNAQEMGPIDQEALDEAARRGTLDANAQIWQPGWNDSKLAGEIYPDLVPVFAAAASPAAAQTPAKPAPDQPAPGEKIEVLQLAPEPQPSWKIALVIMLPVLGGMLIALSVIMQAPATVPLIMGIVFGGLGLALFWVALFNLRALFGDDDSKSTLRVGLLIGGGVLTALGYGILLLPASIALFGELF